jgi:hypothetical protein
MTSVPTKLFGLLFMAVTALSFPYSHRQQHDELPFSITIAPVNNAAKAGSQIYITVKVMNTTKQEMPSRGAFYAAGLNTSFQYDCRTTEGKPVNKKVLDFASVPGSVHDSQPLRPGASYEETAPISLACDLSKPGEYDIQVSRKVLNDPQRRVVKSNVIKITVKPEN